MGITVIGIFPVCNTGCICVHELDGDRVLASMNGRNPEWCDMAEQMASEYFGSWIEEDDLLTGFLFGSFFVPFCMVERI